MRQRLEGKVAVITGSTYGIGRATAILFAQEGARVVVNGRTAERGEQVVEEIRLAGGEASFFHADLTEPGAVQNLVEFAAEKYGRLDVMMNNAYGTAWKGVVDLEEADWDRSLSIMLKAVFLGCKHAIPHMVKHGGGAIINTSSVHGYLAARHSAPYEAAKAGVINLTRQVAVDFGPQGVRANAICPGAIIVEHTEPIYRDHPEYLRLQELMYPLRRVGQPIEVAQAALFLASDDSSFISGHALVVDGGMTAQLQDTLIEVFDRYYRSFFARERGMDKRGLGQADPL